MTDVTRILCAIEQGDARAAEQLLPLVYDELRKLAAAKMAQENPGQTLQATALVHEAFMRLVDVEKAKHWNSRVHFFRAAAEAMRQILVDAARRRRSLKRGGQWDRVDLGEVVDPAAGLTDDVLAISEALEKLAQRDPEKAELVKLRYFAGLSVQEAADTLGISRATAARHWSYAKTWLYCQMTRDGQAPPD